MSRKFVILISSEHILKFLEEKKTSIGKSPMILNLKKEAKKFFPSLYVSEKKNYQNEQNNNEIKNIKEI